MKKYCILVILLAIILFYVFYGENKDYHISSIENESYISKITNSNSYTIKDLPYIEYTMNYQIDEVIPPKEREYSLDDIINYIDETTKDLNNNFALYYYNFDTKEEYAFNENTYFVAASLKKLPQIMQVLDKVSKGELSLNTEIEYIESSDYLNGTGILQYEDNIHSCSIEELIKLSIIESDNIAHNMLSRICNYTLEQYIDSITTDYTAVDEEYIKLTAKQNYEILYRLYTNPDNNPYYSDVIELMKETVFHDRLDKYIPHDKVSHKIGSYYRYYHDIGFIFAKETYILVILSKDIGELSNSSEFELDQEERILVDWGDESCDLIAKISNTIYNIIER